MINYDYLPRFIAAPAACLLFIAACSGDPGEEPDGENDGDQDDPYPESCEVESWNCGEVVDGFALSIRRHGHSTIVLDEGRVLLVGGSERDENHTSSGTDTWEVVDTVTEEIIAFEEFEEERRRPSLVQLDGGSVLAVGGLDRRGDPMSSVIHFDPENLVWSSAPGMNAPYRRAVGLHDDGAIALGVTHSSGHAEILGQIFDPTAYSWSSVQTGTLPHDQVWDLTFETTPHGKALLLYRHLAPPSVQPSDFDVYNASLALFDYDSGDVELVSEFDEIIGVDFHLDITFLGDSGEFVVHLRPFDLEEELDTHAYIVSSDLESVEELYVREPPPGQVLTVLPGDEIIYRGATQMQLFDVPEDRWRNFGALPDGIYYSSKKLLPDCRLFMSGERTLNRPNEELRRLDTAFCIPE